MAEASDSSPERIAKALSRAGVASRRDAERMIAEGRVSVNGRVIDTPATLVTPDDRIAVDGAPLAPPEAPRLWLFHKPAGVVTTARDEKGRQTVFDILPEGLPRVMTVGRLDLTSEGLLLLTNDGAIKRRLELPSTGWTRKYRVRVNGRPEDAQLAPLREGLTLDGERFQPMTVTIDRQQGANAWLTVAIREGKNREIRRAMEAVGLTVNRLIRTGYGPFRLGELAPGAVEEVRARVLRDQLGLEKPADEAGSGQPSNRRPPRPRPAAEGGAAKPARPRASAGGPSAAAAVPPGSPARARGTGLRSAGGAGAGEPARTGVAGASRQPAGKPGPAAAPKAPRASRPAPAGGGKAPGPAGPRPPGAPRGPRR